MISKFTGEDEIPVAVYLGFHLALFFVELAILKEKAPTRGNVRGFEFWSLILLQLPIKHHCRFISVRRALHAQEITLCTKKRQHQILT